MKKGEKDKQQSSKYYIEYQRILEQNMNNIPCYSCIKWFEL